MSRVFGELRGMVNVGRLSGLKATELGLVWLLAGAGTVRDDYVIEVRAQVDALMVICGMSRDGIVEGLMKLKRHGVADFELRGQRVYVDLRLLSDAEMRARGSKMRCWRRS